MKRRTVRTADALRRWPALLAIGALAMGGILGVPSASQAVTTYSETAGGVAHTWTNYSNAGGIEGPQIGAQVTVQIACKLTGFKVADGNTWWYRIASAPWSNVYYVSADAFYNNGATSGGLAGTPFVDPAVPDCSAVSGDIPPTVQLNQGPAAPAGYRYAISLTNFAAGSAVSITCFDSVSPGGFYTFSLTTNAAGAASTAAYCYSGDGPDHWVVAGGVASNHVAWGSGSAGGGTGTGGGGQGAGGGGAGTGGGVAGGGGSGQLYYAALGDSYASGEGNAPFDKGTATSSDKCHRSPDSWTRQMASATSTVVYHFACSGALVANLQNGQYTEGSQYWSLAHSVGGHNIGLVTVMVGGNDVGFSTILGSCRFYPRCLSNISSNQATIRSIAGQIKTTVLPNIKTAASKAQIALVGYPQLFPTTQSETHNCGWLTPAKRANLNALAGYIDTQYRAAAKAAGVTYISTLNSLRGHELCSADSWVNPITGLGTNWLTNADQGHPTRLGQAAIKTTVEKGLGLTELPTF